MGALIFARKSDEPRTLYFAFFLVAFGTIWLADPGSTLAVANPAWHIPAVLIDFIAGSTFTLFGFLFPSGRFVPAGRVFWRWRSLSRRCRSISSPARHST